MLGASQVNNEFEVGFSEQFEGRWHIVELFGRVLMAAFVAIAALGLLGRGPFSHAHLASATGALSVDFEPIARFGTPTVVTLHIANPADTPRRVAVRLGQTMIEPMGFTRSVPSPVTSAVSADGATLDFLIDPHQSDALIRFQLQPTGVGRIRLRAGAGRDEIAWSMFVVP